MNSTKRNWLFVCLLLAGAAVFLITRLYTRGESIWPDFIFTACVLTSAIAAALFDPARTPMSRSCRKWAIVVVAITIFHGLVLTLVYIVMDYVKPMDLARLTRKLLSLGVVLVGFGEYWATQRLLAGLPAKVETPHEEDEFGAVEDA